LTIPRIYDYQIGCFDDLHEVILKISALALSSSNMEFCYLSEEESYTKINYDSDDESDDNYASSTHDSLDVAGVHERALEVED
jgi:hypothetical protein